MNTCPECRDGKHRNCIDIAINDADEFVACDCLPTHNSQEGP